MQEVRKDYLKTIVENFVSELNSLGTFVIIEDRHTEYRQVVVFGDFSFKNN